MAHTTSAPGDTADRILSLITGLMPSSDPRPLKWRAGPAGRASGAHTTTRAAATAAAREHNAFRAAMIARGAMTSAAPRWVVEPFTPRGGAR